MNVKLLRERHIDRLLAEEFETSAEFALWFAQRVLGEQVPTSTPDSILTTIGHHRLNGETDILVEFEWTDLTIELHIEDKIGAQPQPRQAARYNEALKDTKATIAGNALVAPSAWLRRHPKESAQYQAVIPFETIANQLAKRRLQLEKRLTPEASELAARLRWREQLLTGATQKSTLYSAIQDQSLTDWNIAAAELIFARNGLQLGVSNRQKSKSAYHKIARFIKFEEQLSPHQNGKLPTLRLKTANEKNPGRVSIEVANAFEDEPLKKMAQQAGYAINSTKKGTLVISQTRHSLRDLKIDEPVTNQIDAIETAADIAQELIEWWEQLCVPKFLN
ncbi:MAG: hypothetical protein AAF490_18545 [Chloroflexota bacterium]